MRHSLVLGAAAALLVAAVGDASATMPSFPSGNVQFGRPDYSNYLSRPKAVTCDWQYQNYFRACPTPHPPPKPTDQPPTHKTGQS